MTTLPQRQGLPDADDTASTLSAPDAPGYDWDDHWQRYEQSQYPAVGWRAALVGRLLAPQPGARVIDIGSGPGDLAVALERQYPGISLLGIELSYEGVAISRRRVPSARFEQCDLITAPDPPAELRQFADHAVCSEVIEHVDEPLILLRNVQQWLAPGCRLVVTVPGGPMSAFDRHIGHRRHYSVSTLRSLLDQAGFEVEEVFASGFPFFNLYRLAVIARGRKLIEAGSSEESGPSRGVAGAAMRVFRVLFRANRTRSRLGWQIVGIARVPGSPSAA